jgi:hypothetical protein
VSPGQVGNCHRAYRSGVRVAFYVGSNIEPYEVDKPSTGTFAGTAILKPDPLS